MKIHTLFSPTILKLAISFSFILFVGLGFGQQVLMTFNVNYDCDLDGNIDSTKSYFSGIYSVHLENATDTIYPTSYSHVTSEYSWPSGAAAGTYNIVVDSASIASIYGFSLDTIFSSTITLPVSGTPPSITATFGCAHTSCIQGYIFCDDNGNGTLDSIESGILNAKIVLNNYAGINNDTLTADSTGFYFATWPSTYPYAHLQLDNSWLNAMGYLPYNTSQFISNPNTQNYLDCSAGHNVNFPLNCNVTAADSVCFDGTTFDDYNNNGVQDGSEPFVANVPMDLYLDGNYITSITSDASGYYSFSDYYPNTDTVLLTVNTTWLSNNNYTAPAPNYLPYFQCDSANTNNTALYSTTNFNFSNIFTNTNFSPAFCDSVKIGIASMWYDNSSSSNLKLYFTGTNVVSNTQLSLSVTWGDGSTTSHSGTIFSHQNDINWSPVLGHLYSSPGNYSIQLTLTELATQNSITTTINNINKTTCTTDLFNPIVHYDCNADGIVDSVSNLFIPSNYLSLVNANNSYTSLGYDSGSGHYIWDSLMQAGSYTPTLSPSSINPLWGYNNGQTYDAVISTSPANITIPSTGPAPNVIFTIGCTDTIQGVSFCDLNQDSTKNSYENPLANVSLVLITDTDTFNITTDSLGQYSQIGYGITNSNATLTIDSTWLSNSGNSANQTLFSNLNNHMLNIPILCTGNATLSDSVCFDGVTFNDYNNNGIQDGNESVVANVALNLYFDGVSITTIYSDNNGYYHYANYFPNVDSVLLTVKPSWLTSNNYSASTTNFLTYFKCDSANTTNTPLYSTSNFSFGNLVANNNFPAGFCDSLKIGIAPVGYDNTDDSNLKLFFTGSNLAQSTLLNAEVNWGDGSITTHTGTIGNNNTNINWSPSLNHIYSTFGNYSVQITLIDQATQDSIATTINNVNVVSCITNVFNPIIHKDCNGDGIIDSVSSIILAPAHLGLVNSGNITVNPISYDQGTGQYTWPSLPNGTYDVKLTGSVTYYLAGANNGATYDHVINVSPPTLTFPNSGVTPNVIFTVGCGDTVTGNVFCDINQNGYKDPTESSLAGASLTFTTDTDTVNIISDSQGDFLHTGLGLSTLNPVLTINQGWLNSYGYTANQTVFTNPISTQYSPTYIPINCASSCSNLWTSLKMDTGYFQNFANRLILDWGNLSQQTSGNYDLTLTYPGDVTPDFATIANTNYTTSTNSITWNLSTLNSTLTDTIVFNMPTGIADSTFHTYESTIVSLDSLECDTTNNVSNLGLYVGVSYDPNDKYVNQPYYLNPLTQEKFSYRIRFQNTGTAPAQDVFIIDTLSPYLDWSSFRVLNTSHPMQVIDLGSGIIKFDFPQIWLPDSASNEPASHGHINYTINESSTININDVIENTAYIYFDQNSPIVTNTTKNVNVLGLGLTKYEESAEITVFPNPSSGLFNLSSPVQINTISVYDLSGKLVHRSYESDSFATLDLTELSKGMYQIRVETLNGTDTKKLILK